MYYFIFTNTLASLLITAVLLLSLSPTLAQVRSSTNYQLQSDSINVGGGLSSSTNFVQESTVGEVATGESSSNSFNLYAGYQQMQEVYLSMTTAPDVVMDTDIPGISGGTANGTTSVKVTTDDPAGYQLTITSESEPAMQGPGGNSIADYEEGAEPDFSFNVGGGEAYFGFTPSGTDIHDSFKDNGSSCSTGSSDTLFACWAGLSTSSRVISQGTGANHPNGATTTVNFRVGVGSGGGVIAGVYTATSTITALPL